MPRAVLPCVPTGNAQPPPQVPVAPGTYHVIVVADGRGEVGESNELDGVFVVPDTVTVN